jgi:CHASE2 domain-containing sensor protein
LLLALPVFLLVLFIRFSGLLDGFERASNDLFNRLVAKPEASKDVVVVGFGDADYKRFPDYPYSDATLAEALRKIAAAEPRAIILNMLRDAPVEPGHNELLEVYRSLPNLYGSAIQPYSGREEVAPPPVLKESGRFGSLMSLQDEDGLARHFPLGFKYQGAIIEQLHLKVLSDTLATGDKAIGLTADGHLNIGGRRFAPADYHGGLTEAEQIFSFLIPFRHLQPVPLISFSTLLDNQFPASSLRGKIVLLGNSSLSVQHGSLTPVMTGINPGLTGVEINAALVDNLIGLERHELRAIVPLPPWFEWALLYLLAWLACWRFMSFRSVYGGLLRGLVWFAALFVLAYFAYRFGIGLPITALAMTLLGAVTVVIDNLLRAEAGQRRWVSFLRSVFDRLPEPIYVLDHHDRFRLVNEAFSRLVGLPPDEVVGSDFANMIRKNSERASDARLEVGGRSFRLRIESSDSLDEHGRGLTLGLVRAVEPERAAEPEAQTQLRARYLRTALWWQQRGRGCVGLIALRLADPELLVQAYGPDAMVAASEAVRERLGVSFPDAIDVWREGESECCVLISRGDDSLKQSSIERMLRQSFSWPVSVKGESIQLDLNYAYVQAEALEESLASLTARAQLRMQELQAAA